MSKVEVNQISSQCGSTLTIGQSGDTVQLASGATQTGFGRTGTVDWDTTKKTAAFTAVSGNGYFVDTSSAAITATLPASPSAGDIVSFSDYTGSFGTNKLTIARNGSNIQGEASDFGMAIDEGSITLIYVDSTEGWRVTNTGLPSEVKSPFIEATGGTITTCGNCKIHTFTSPGTFCVSTAGTPTNAVVSYMVVAGGGGAMASYGGGGGAGGYREGRTNSVTPYTASPLAATTSLPVTASAYPITVGAGGAGQVNPGVGRSKGSNSIFSTITSAGGGIGCGQDGNPAGTDANGGSGGGNGHRGAAAGSGNTPPVTPPQGNNGGSSGPNGYAGDGGGGAGAVGGAGTSSGPSSTGGNGGAGTPTSISGSATTYAGGGGGGTFTSGSGGCGGAGGGGDSGGPPGNAGNDGTANTGGGGGGGSGPTPTGGSGGSGIVILRYKFQ